MLWTASSSVLIFSLIWYLKINYYCNFRYKIVRNVDWQCEICTLAELPGANISNSQIRNLNSSNEIYQMPSAPELNKLFIDENVENDDENFEFTYHSNKSKYMYTNEIEDLKFVNQTKLYESFPIISVNIRSIVNSKNFTKFESLLEALPVKPMVIAISESWVTNSSKGAFTKIL